MAHRTQFSPPTSSGTPIGEQTRRETFPGTSATSDLVHVQSKCSERSHERSVKG